MAFTDMKFSQTRCRELAATQRLMMEMPENQLTLMTQIATILVCDYDGSLKLRTLTREIYCGNEDERQRTIF